jgi:phospholipid N-methyltransferase
MRQQWSDYRIFWRQFRSTYRSTGAVLPSGRALAAALARYVDQNDRGEAPSQQPLAGMEQNDRDGVFANGGCEVTSGRRILEVGPGTGAVTGRILRVMRPDDRLVLVERNEQFVGRLRARLADIPAAAEHVELVHASVEDLPDEPRYDLIISGLPLNNFDGELVARILSKLRRLLATGGTLSFFEYVGVRRAKSLVSRAAERARLQAVGRVLRELLDRHEVHRELVLANVPPAWVHHVRF